MQALYHPNVDPPMGWIRSAALFFDTIRSFVPAEAEDTLPSDLHEFADSTKAWEPYRPTQSTAELVDVPTETLDKAFRAIASERKPTPGKVEFEIVFEGTRVRVKDHVFMHGCKLSERVKKRLQAHRLILPKVVAEPFMKGDWWLVHEEASDLILSYISDRLAAANKGWISITDNESCYGFNALHLAAASPGLNKASDRLAKVLVTQLVPDVIETAPMSDYKKLRERYAPIRDRLTVFLNDIVVENRLGDIGDAAALQQAVEECARELRQEVLDFSQSVLGRSIRKWGPFALGGICTVASKALPTEFALPLAAGSLVFGFVDKAGVLQDKATPRREMVRLLAAARKDIIQASTVKRFLVA